MDSGRLACVSWRAIPIPCLFASRDWIVSLRCALILSVSGTSVSNPVPSNDTPRLPTRSIIVQRLAPPQDLFDTTTAPHVAPTGPTMPHGPESRHHHSSTLSRLDWPHDDTWTRIMILVFDQKLKPLQTSEMGRLVLIRNKLAIQTETKTKKR